MRKIKVALITSGNPNDTKGIMNFVQEKVKRLQQQNNINLDVFIIRRKDSLLFSLLRGKRRPKLTLKENIRGIEFRNIWVKNGLYDYILSHLLYKRPFTGMKCLKKYSTMFSSYDIITTHKLDSHYIAMMVNRIYGIPFITTWHGSDINVIPNINKKSRSLIKDVINTSYINYFVSKKLLDTSNNIIHTSNKDYLYTGPSQYFYQYSPEKKSMLRKQYNIENNKVVGFVGNIIPIKNIKALPEIFTKLYLYSNKFVFWIVGNGILEQELKERLNKSGVPFKMFGNVDPNKIPELMNCFDVLVLPSFNEGLPLVTLEAITCGSNVVGSNVGGISEVIGNENVFKLDNNFICNITNRINEIIKNDEKPKPLSKEFSWDMAIKKEVDSYKTLLNKQNC